MVLVTQELSLGGGRIALGLPCLLIARPPSRPKSPQRFPADFELRFGILPYNTSAGLVSCTSHRGPLVRSHKRLVVWCCEKLGFQRALTLSVNVMTLALSIKWGATCYKYDILPANQLLGACRFERRPRLPHA